MTEWAVVDGFITLSASRSIWWILLSNTSATNYAENFGRYPQKKTFQLAKQLRWVLGRIHGLRPEYRQESNWSPPHFILRSLRASFKAKSCACIITHCIRSIKHEVIVILRLHMSMKKKWWSSTDIVIHKWPPFSTFS